jgi:hypothetical protein
VECRIKISRKEPELIKALPRLIARLPDNYPKKVELDLPQHLYRIRSGYAGEIKVDRYLELFGPPKSSIILTNIQLALAPGHTFQIDTLILTEKYVLLLEVKNIKGDLYFETNPHQLRRELNGKTTIMECSITQLQAAKENLQTWLSQRGINLEIHSQIVLVNKNSAVKQVPPGAPIIYLKRLFIFLQELETMPTINSQSQLQNISELIRGGQLKYNVYPLCDHFEIDPNLLKRGQLCSRCNKTMSYKTRRKRYCTHCKTNEAINYSESIQDWFILINKSISNRQCRNFLQLKKRDDAYYALTSLRLIKEGKSISTKYYWPEGTPFKYKNPKS